MRKIIALFSAAAVLASSAAASAHERYRHGYDRDHGYPAYGYGHHYRAYPQLRYPGYQPYYGQGYNYPPYGYAPGYYYQPGAYGYYAPDDYNRTCDDAAAGAILGGVAGAVNRTRDREGRPSQTLSYVESSARRRQTCRNAGGRSARCGRWRRHRVEQLLIAAGLNPASALS